MTLTANKGQCERTPLHFDVVYSVPGVVCPLNKVGDYNSLTFCIVLIDISWC